MHDWHQIANTVASLAVCLDCRDWDGLVDVFAPVVHLDLEALEGSAAQPLDARDLVAGWAKVVPGFNWTTHLIGTPLIEIEGNTAKVRAPVANWHVLNNANGNELWQTGGTYHFRIERIEGRWRIAAMTLAQPWTLGDRDLLRQAEERAAAQP